MAEAIPTKRRSELNGKTLTYVGYGFYLGIQVSFYEHGNEYVVCMSQPGKAFNQVAAKLALGVKVRGEEIAPFAQRHLEGCTFPEFQQLMADCFKQFKMEWRSA